MTETRMIHQVLQCEDVMEKVARRERDVTWAVALECLQLRLGWAPSSFKVALDGEQEDSTSVVVMDFELSIVSKSSSVKLTETLNTEIQSLEEIIGRWERKESTLVRTILGIVTFPPVITIGAPILGVVDETVELLM